MQFQQPGCPKCRRLATHILESLLCHVPIAFRGQEADYTGDSTKFLWDISEISRTVSGQVTLHCDDCAILKS